MAMQSRDLRTVALLVAALVQLSASNQCAAGESLLPKIFNSDNLRTNAVNEVAVKLVTLNEDMEIRGLDFSPDGKYLAATSTMDSDEVHIWDWRGSKSIVQKMKKGGGSAGPVSEPLRYSPDGRYLAAGHGRSESTRDTLRIVVHIWDTRTGSLAHYVDADSGNCEALGFSPDGQTLFRITAAGGPRPDAYNRNSSILAYSTNTWQVMWGLETIPFHPSTLAISPDGKFAAVGGRTSGPRPFSVQPQILIIDLPKHAIARTIDAFPVDYAIQSIAWHPDGTHLAASTGLSNTSPSADVVRIFDVRTGEIVAAASPKWPAYVAAGVDILRYSPDGKYLVESGDTVMKDGIYRHVHIWDGQHRTLLQEIHAQPTSMEFSRDGQFLAMGGDKTILVWQLK